MNNRGNTSSTKRRLALAVFRIILGFTVVCLFAYFTIDEISTYIGSTKILTNVRVAGAATNALHFLLLERGATMQIISITRYAPNDELLASITAGMKEYRQQVDGTIGALQQFVGPNSVAQEFLDTLAPLSSLRKRTDNNTISLVDAMNEWEAMVKGLLWQLFSNAPTFDPDLTRSLLAQETIAGLMDSVGVVRAMWSSLFRAGYVVDTALVQTAITANQNSNLFADQFKGFATPEQTEFFNNAFANPVIGAALVASTNAVAAGKENLTRFINFTYDAQVFWDNTTTVLAACYKVADFLAQNTIELVEYKVQPSVSTILALFVVGFLLELTASVQLCWLAAPILKFYISTEISLHTNTSSGKGKTLSNGPAAGRTDPAAEC